jgi:cyclopropane fatty-acyl-phospholipid synthase-like methyltransferase
MLSNHLQLHYNDWRLKRARKLESILGREFFPGKTVLEVGAGHGRIGKYFRETYGSTVEFTEGRIELIDTIRRLNEGASAYLVDHDSPQGWQLNNRYDLIIHWGLLYHLVNWNVDLESTVRHLKSGGILTLESEVVDSDSDITVPVREDTTLDDQSLHGPAVRNSATIIEKKLLELGLRFQRYDDADLNSDIHQYDWQVSNTGRYGSYNRRFWVCYT